MTMAVIAGTIREGEQWLAARGRSHPDWIVVTPRSLDRLRGVPIEGYEIADPGALTGKLETMLGVSLLAKRWLSGETCVEPGPVPEVTT